MTKLSAKALAPLVTRTNLKSVTGFTLIELLLTFSILAFCLCGLLLTYINMFLLADLARDLTQATNLVQAKMEEIKQTDFAALAGFTLDYDENSFFQDEAQYNAGLKKGVIIATLTNTAYDDLRQARIITCFNSRGRVIGEDKNLNAVLDAGEDILIVNGVLDSPVEAATLITETR